MISAPLTVQRVLLALWAVYGALSEAFALTPGLAYPDADQRSGLAYVNDLESLGSDDNLCIEIGIVISAVGVLWAVVRRNGRFMLRDFAVNFFLVACQAAYLAAMEMGAGSGDDRSRP